MGELLGIRGDRLVYKFGFSTFYVKEPSRRSSTALYLPAPFAFVVLHFGPGAAGKQEPNYSLVPTLGSLDQRCCTTPVHVFTLLP